MRVVSKKYIKDLVEKTQKVLDSRSPHKNNLTDEEIVLLKKWDEMGLIKSESYKAFDYFEMQYKTKWKISINEKISYENTIENPNA